MTSDVEGEASGHASTVLLRVFDMVYVTVIGEYKA